MLVNDDCIEDGNFILYLSVINGGRKNGSFFKLMDEGYARETEREREKWIVLFLAFIYFPLLQCSSCFFRSKYVSILRRKQVSMREVGMNFVAFSCNYV